MTELCNFCIENNVPCPLIQLRDVERAADVALQANRGNGDTETEEEAKTLRKVVERGGPIILYLAGLHNCPNL